MASQKRTNVRFNVVSGLKPAFGLVSRLAPPVATQLAAQLFCRPQRPRRPARERRWLADAHPFRLVAERWELAAWSWGDGPTVLLMHGWSGRGSQLAALARPLVDAGFSVVAIDGPAHGDSPGRATNGIELGRAVRAAGHRLGGLHAVVAHSLGCTAASLALQHGLPAERLVYLCPPGSMLLGTHMFCEQLGFPPPIHDAMIAWWERRLDISGEMFEAESLARGRTEPLLVVQDDDDPYVPAGHAERLAAAWAGAQLHRTRRLGHHRILSDPGVIERIVTFLAEPRRPSLHAQRTHRSGRSERPAPNRQDRSPARVAQDAARQAE